ncbi:uncharacterized protein KY384_000639 [Bacidia gigantensis]|uniref:uncharacterized protein n=1 Tax=Bacidia gigantensis TaxID=2732470 RepID=UPI001D0407C5|nr:uncharacterized protein KY384_000639 [Bacidia gigantensis]KAG8525879.1 hypothetical protein KY384_000639 [Bacidia gigantensis]
MSGSSTAAFLHAATISLPAITGTTPEELKEKRHHLNDGSGFINPWLGLGHACYFVEFPKGFRVLFDPGKPLIQVQAAGSDYSHNLTVFSERCSPFSWLGPKRYTEKPCGIEDIPNIDAVVISHNHYDHMDHPTIMKIFHEHPAVHFFCPLGNKQWFVKSGIDNVTELDWWDERDIALDPWVIRPSEKAPIAALKLVLHVSRVNTQALGLLLTKEELCGQAGALKVAVFFGGDTGYRSVPQLPKDVDDYGPDQQYPHCPAFKEIGAYQGPFDLGLIPIGAYDPRHIMSPMHANPFDSVNIFKDTKCKRAMGIHWGTWVLTEEDVLEPPMLLKQALSRSDIQTEGIFDVCDIGEMRSFELYRNDDSSFTILYLILISPRPGTTTPSAAATLAASQAFLANRASNANLSASAAAAALRSHTTSPTPIGEIQTRRMQRRGSVTSNGSAPGRPVSLQRRDSGGSMTERTFRDPSPSRPERPASSHGPYPNYKEELPPPVPALPPRFASPPPTLQNSRRRPASVEPPRRSGLPQKGIVDQGADDRYGSGALPVRTTNKQRLSSLDTTAVAHQAANKANNRASVNFSRPMSPQVSLESSQLNTEQERSPTPRAGTIANLNPGEAQPLETSPQATSKRPAKAKKKRAVGDSEMGIYSVAERSEGGINTGESLVATNDRRDKPQNDVPFRNPAHTNQNVGQLSASTPTKTRKKKRRTLPVAEGEALKNDDTFGSAYPSDTDSAISDVSSTTDVPRNISTRATGTLGKQPSILREDREGEAKAENKTGIGRTEAGHMASETSHSENNTARSPAIQMDVATTQGPQASVRQLKHGSGPRKVNMSEDSASLSPARAAHFSARLVYDSPTGTKHQPPARSASPAKSALKTSPSRGQSPALVRNKASTAGETSDTASAVSDDSSRLGAKQSRKHARVSFDDDSIVMDRTPSPSPRTQLQEKPRNEQVRKGTTLPKDDDQEHKDMAIKPTPALPSFGSVRNFKGKDTETSQAVGKSLIVKGTDQVTSPEPASRSNLGRKSESGVSTGLFKPDHQDVTSSGIAKEGTDGLPKTVTTQVSAPSLDEKVRGGNNAEEVETKTKDPRTIGEPTGILESLVPAIAVMPATPGLDENGTEGRTLGLSETYHNETKSSEHAINSEDTGIVHQANNVFDSPLEPQRIEQAGIQKSMADEHHPSPIITPATLGLAEPDSGMVAAQHESGAPYVGDVALSIRTQIDSQSGEESAEDDSVYSDAAEDQIENEGDGYGSINAIVESPTSPQSPLADKSTTSPLLSGDQTDVDQDRTLALNATKTSEDITNEQQNSAQGYWSGLSASQRQQLERAALPGAVDERIVPERTMRGKQSIANKKKKQATKPVTASSVRGDPSSQVEKAKKKQVTTPKMSIENQQASPPARSVNLKAANPTRARPATSAPIAEDTLSPLKISNKHARAASANVTLNPVTAKANQAKSLKPQKPKLGRTKSNGSDSDSSFKRNRSSNLNTGKYQMKRSMRGGPADTGSIPAKRGNSVGVRTVSPTSSAGRRAFSQGSPTGIGMRKSMRSSLDSNQQGRTSLRLSMDSSKAGRTKSPSRLGFGLGSKPKKMEKHSGARGSRGFSSRFGDSSDDDDTFDLRAQSRFADSSDEDTPDLTPVRGIPRQIDEGDSTELEDSSTENVQEPRSGKSIDTQPTSVSAPSSKTEGLALASGSLRSQSKAGAPTPGFSQLDVATPKEKKKRSIFGGFGSKRKEKLETARITQLGTLREQKEASPPAIQASSGSAAQNEQTVSQASPKSPKLQRRMTPKKLPTASDKSWPLAGKNEKPVASRPQTSDGARPSDLGSRPDMGNRRVTLQTPVLPSPTAPIVDGLVTRKKRFHTLRKAFGLRD